MTEYIFLIIILGTRFFQHYYNKKSSDMVSGRPMYLSYGTYRYALSSLIALILLLVSKGSFAGTSLQAVLISSLAGISLVVSLFTSLEAMKSGAMVLVNLASSAGLLLPCLFGIFLFNEPMSLLQWLGIALLLFSAYLLAGYSKGLNGVFTPRTVLLLVGAMLSNGAVMLAQKMFSLYTPDTDAAVFSLLTFGIAGLAFLIMLVAAGRVHRAGSPAIVSNPSESTTVKPSETAGRSLPTKLLIYGAILSLILLVINQLSTMAAAVIPSAILFTLNDGGSTIISAIVGSHFFGEKLTPRGVSGILLGILSLVVINIF